MKRRWWFQGVSGVAAMGLLFAPSLASACAVCTAGRDEENAFAFLMTTIFMSLMPLIAVGSVVYVLWRRIRKLEAERALRLELPDAPLARSAVRDGDG